MSWDEFKDRHERRGRKLREQHWTSSWLEIALLVAVLVVVVFVAWLIFG